MLWHSKLYGNIFTKYVKILTISFCLCKAFAYSNAFALCKAFDYEKVLFFAQEVKRQPTRGQ